MPQQAPAKSASAASKDDLERIEAGQIHWRLQGWQLHSCAHVLEGAGGGIT